MQTCDKCKIQYPDIKMTEIANFWLICDNCMKQNNWNYQDAFEWIKNNQIKPME